MLIFQFEPWFSPWNHAIISILKDIPGTIIRNEGWPIIKLGRGKMNSWFEVDGKLHCLDCWDNETDIHTLLKSDIPIKKIFFVQASEECEKTLPRVKQPGFMFATQHLDFINNLPIYQKLVQDTPKIYASGFTGRVWRCRRPWVSQMKGYDFEASTASNGTMLDFYARAASWETGIILQGKKGKLSQGLNRREVEYSALKIPMVLNYQPYYAPEPLIPGVHYIFCPMPSDLNKCVKEAIRRKDELTQAAFRYYEDHFSPAGMRKTFLMII